MTAVAHRVVAQAHLFDANLAQLAREDAISRVDEHAPVEWKEDALQRVRTLCDARHLFTTDAVWALLERDGVEPPHEPRAMGPVMLAAVRAGWCTNTGQYEKSVMTSNHRRPVAVYRSLYWRGDRA